MNICPFCRHENAKGAARCGKCGKDMYVEPQTEWRSYIDQVTQGYRQPPAKGLAHGVQKDAVQNSWGARRGGRSKETWNVEFALTRTSDRSRLLAITDRGTYGLTGQIYQPQDIPDELPVDERLARFENMNFSGGNYGPGLYGRGKLIFQAASRRREIIYDSLTVDGKYRLGRRLQEGRHLRQFPKVLQGNEAEQMLRLLTKGAVAPLKEPGTRIIIVDPVEELVAAIRTGNFATSIAETWWEILLKYDAAIRVTSDGTTKTAKCPALLEKLDGGELPDKQVHRVENRTIEIRGKPYRVKHVVMARANDSIAEDLRGLYVQRKGMKVGTIELKEMPTDLEDKFFGFIGLDKDYEDLIAEAEDLEHYGFSAQFASFRELKKFAQAEFDNFKRKLGYIVDAADSDEAAREALRAAQLKLNELLDNLGLRGIGEPLPRSQEITVRVEAVTFPAGTNEVAIGDPVSDVSFRIDNNSKYTFRLAAFVETRRTNSSVIETLHTGVIELPKGSSKGVGPLAFKLQPSLYPNFEEISCVCRVEDAEDKRVATARIPIYIGIKKPQPLEPVKLKLESAAFPRRDSARVNYGEEIRDVRYLLQNQTSNDLRAKFLVRTLDKARDRQRITTVVEQDIVLKPLVEDHITVPIIPVEKSVYGGVGEGEVILRARVVSAEDQHGYERGDILAEHNLVFWLNRDPEGRGIFEELETFDGGPDKPRAEVRSGSGPDRWIFRLNITHPQYEAISESDQQRTRPIDRHRYVFELMMREALYLALRAERFEAFADQVAVGDVPHDIARAYNLAGDKILATYYQ